MPLVKAGGIAEDEIVAVGQVATGNHVPDLTVVFDVDTDVAMPIERPRPGFARVRVVIGEPIYPDGAASGRISRSAVTAGTAELRQSLQDLYDNRLR